LSYLSEGYFVFVSTHDVELVYLLKGQYEMHHFCELVEENQLAFDYKLKLGAVSEGNAIQILGLYGYPAEIISEEMDLASKRLG
jgi:DNA mismatch repair ATPase MutS